MEGLIVPLSILLVALVLALSIAVISRLADELQHIKIERAKKKKQKSRR